MTQPIQPGQPGQPGVAEMDNTLMVKWGKNASPHGIEWCAK